MATLASQEITKLRFPRELKIPSKDGMKSFPLVIDLARPHEIDEVFSLIKKEFISRPPIDKLIEVENKPDWIRESARQWLSQPYSMTVRDPARNSKLVAVILNELLVKSQSTQEKEIDSITGQQEEFDYFAQTVLHTVNEGVDIFQMYRTDKILSLHLAVVDSEYGCLGLGGKLCDMSIALGKQSNAGAAKLEAVSNYGYKAALKIGFKVLKRVKLEEVEHKGSKPLAGRGKELGIHRESCLMALPLS